MRARQSALLALLASLALPVSALAVENYWPVSAHPSNGFGWNKVNSPLSMDAIADGSGGYFVTWDDGYSGHVQHVVANGSTAWPWYVYQLPGSSMGYLNPAIAPDGQGGVLVSFESHGGSDDLKVQRLTAAGAPAPGWPAGGVPVSPSSDYDYFGDVAADGSGGAYVSFVRSGADRVRVQHVLSSGALDPYWPPDGVEVQSTGSTYERPLLIGGWSGVLVVYVESDRTLRVTHVNSFGGLNPSVFPGNGIALASALPYGPGGLPLVDAVPTLSGGAAIVWVDGHTGSQEVYVDVVDAFGRVGTAPPGGLALTATPGVNENCPAIATDATWELVLAWTSGTQIRGTRLQADLSPHPTFPSAAMVCPATDGYLTKVSLDTDGAGGLVAGWINPSAPTVVWAQHLAANGAVAAGWSAAGDSLAASAKQFYSAHEVFHDGEGGIVGVFDDNHSLATNRLRRDASHGRLVMPILAALNDVPDDQGGRIALYWRASELDTLPSNPVGSYMAWRRMPAIFLPSRLARGARVLAGNESPDAAGPGAIRVLQGATATTYWEYLGSTPARGWAGYGMTVSTNSDQLGPGAPVPWEVFIVEAVSPGGSVLATSAPDSGFSIDNLSPSPPAAFSAVRAGGATHLHWLRNGEGDFRDYRLHRGSFAGFVPADDNLVAALADTGFVDPAPPGAYYKLAALDVHGNASTYALVTPAQTLGVDGPAPGALAFAPVAPNPARGRVSLAYTLPQAGHVRLAVFDAQGRRVGSPVDAPRAAGMHTEAWDLRDASGRALAPGLYLARLETPAGVASRRFVVVE